MTYTVGTTTDRSGGVGICGLLFVAFVVLKLTHVIHWSWLWVCAPLWIPLIVFVVIALLVAVVAATRR